MIDVTKLAEAMGKRADYTPVAADKYSDNKRQEPVVPDFELDDDGEEYQSVGLNGILAATEKQLAVNRGLVPTDERDSMQFQKVFRPHALFRERVKMDSGKLARTALYRAAKTKNLSGVGPGYFNGYIDSVLVGNPLTSPLEEINMMQLVANARRITRMGPGGLQSSDSITEEAQSVHPSQFGFISTVEGPESERAGIDVRVALGTKIGSNGRLYQKMYNRIKKRYEWVSPSDVAGKVVKLPE